MFGSTILEVAIGLAFVYLLLSLICSLLNEWIARALALRAATLKEGIRTLLRDGAQGEDTQRLYSHPLIEGLFQQGRFDRVLQRAGQPSYIPARAFSRALLDAVLGPATPPGRAPGAPVPDPRGEIERLLGTIQGSPVNDELKRVLTTLVRDTDGTIASVRQSVELWFDDQMERVSGWYKRKTQLIIAGLALVVSVALNADTGEVTRALSTDPALRAAAVVAAERTVAEGTAGLARLEEVQRELGGLGLPLGWDFTGVPAGDPGSLLAWVAAKVVGLLLTAMAVSLGAPFWFDLLGKLVNVRQAGRVAREDERAAPAAAGRQVLVIQPDGEPVRP